MALLSLSVPAAWAQARPTQVIDLRVEGNERMTPEAILSHVKTRLGQAYSEDIIRADKQALLDTGHFTSVVVTKTQTDKGIVVTFIVAERPLVTKIMFVGNKTFSDSKLVGELPFGPSDPINQANVNAGREALETKYKSSGYHFATVTVDKAALDREKRAVYKIVEGPRVVITKVTFEGNNSYSGIRLLQKVATRKRMWPIFTGYLNTEELKQDVTALRTFYRNEGYLDCEVGRALDFSFDKKKAVIRFIIKEGGRYRVNKVVFKGNAVFSSDELSRRIRLAQGAFYTVETLRQDVRKLEATYGEMGYIEARVTPGRTFLAPNAPVPPWAAALAVDGKPALVNVVFTIVESDQYRIGLIGIRGNTVTQQRIIRRSLRIFPEQLYNTEAVKESRHRLIETRLFDKVDIVSVKSNKPKVKNVQVIVEEGRTAEFLVGVGVSTNSGVLGNVSFTQRNFDLFNPASGFRGAGQTLRIVAEPGTEMMRFHLSWYEPYLFDKPYSLGVKAFAWTRDREAWDETRYGTVVTVGHRFKSRWYGQLSTRVEGVDIGGVDSDAAEEIRDDDGQHMLVGLKGTLVRDRTDSRWMPSRGSRFSVSYEQVVGDYTFGNVYTDYRYYHTLHVDALDRKHILATRLAGGHILGDAPFFERYYGGGIGSIRGFAYRGISPRGDNTDDAIGGDMMLFVGTEYTFPIIGRELRGAVFLDTGTVEESFSLSGYRVSMGVGLRWVIPMFGPVPISLDFGFPIAKDGDDDTQLLSFSLGWTF